MRTYYLSDEDVKGYAVDLIQRLRGVSTAIPAVWASVGISGDKFVDVLDNLLEEEGKDIPPVSQITWDRQEKKVLFRNDFAEEIIREAASSGAPVVLIDSAVHSGQTMNAIAEYLYDQGVVELISYGLVIKRGSEFVPTFFGLMVGECDRAYFQLQSIHNHRVCVHHPIGILRKLNNLDLNREFVVTEDESINKKTFGDLHYLAITQGFETYVYQIARDVVGVVTFKDMGNRELFIDLVARSVCFKHTKAGASLMRWAENYARHANCTTIGLMAVERAVDRYKDFGYRISGAPVYCGGGETIFPMKKAILYNVKNHAQVELGEYD